MDNVSTRELQIDSIAEEIKNVPETREGDFEINLNLAGSNPVATNDDPINNPSNTPYLLIGGAVLLVALIAIIARVSKSKGGK